MTRLACTIALALLGTACGGGDGCIEDVPFSIDTNLTQADADRLATELGVASIADECDAACTQLSDENESPDGSTYSVTQVESCTLMMPSTDASGDPVDGYVRCEGSGTRCP